MKIIIMHQKFINIINKYQKKFFIVNVFNKKKKKIEIIFLHTLYLFIMPKLNKLDDFLKFNVLRIFTKFSKFLRFDYLRENKK